jgi:hypothetical protein
MTVSPPKYGFPDNFPLILVFGIEKTLVKPIAAIFVVQESLHIYDLKILAIWESGAHRTPVPGAGR